MNGKFKVYRISSAEFSNDILIAYLHDLPFEGFVEEHSAILAYIPLDKLPEDFEDIIKSAIPGIVEILPEVIDAKNWNEVWEQNFHPVIISDFCAIRAPFHSPIGNVVHELVIKPEMAFGTGHHETTKMVITLMAKLKIDGNNVLDFGCGTGVLGILSSKMGAISVDMVDNDPVARASAEMNWHVNQCPETYGIFSGMQDLKEGYYDLILANVNASVLQNFAGKLSRKSGRGGYLILSGIMTGQLDNIMDCYHHARYNPVKIQSENDWMAVLMRKN